LQHVYHARAQEIAQQKPRARRAKIVSKLVMVQFEFRTRILLMIHGRDARDIWLNFRDVSWLTKLGDRMQVSPFMPSDTDD